MKKLIIVAALALSATLANAASLTWGSNANFVDADGNVLTSATAPAGNIVLVYLGTGTADWDSAVAVQNATVNYASSMGKTTSKASTTFYFTYEADSTKYSAANGLFGNGAIFGVMFDDGSSLSYLQSGGADLKPTYTISGMANDTSTLSGFTYASSAYSASVPEPTSGILMLVGLGALALRRRKA